MRRARRPVRPEICVERDRVMVEVVGSEASDAEGSDAEGSDAVVIVRT
jgi:hypothetical protein